MFSFYPQAGVRYNPIFTETQFARFPREAVQHAADLRSCASAAFGRAAEWPSGHVLNTLNFECLIQSSHALLGLYRVAREDTRFDLGAIGSHINLLFWEIIGAAEHLLRFQDGDDYLKDWQSSFERGGLLARLAAELALAGAASPDELGEMTASLSRLSVWTAGVRDYHLEMVREVPDDVDELVEFASIAGKLAMTLGDAAARLRARLALEQTAALRS